MGTENKRVNDKLRSMVDRACEGIMPHIAERIQAAARRAYYLGCEDGMAMQRDTKEQDNENASDIDSATLARRVG